MKLGNKDKQKMDTLSQGRARDEKYAPRMIKVEILNYIQMGRRWKLGKVISGLKCSLGIIKRPVTCVDAPHLKLLTDLIRLNHY